MGLKEWKLKGLSTEGVAKMYLKNWQDTMKRIEDAERVPVQVPGVTASEDTPIHSFYEDTECENVILCRVESPHFFAGILRSGRAAWTSDIRYARPVSGHRVHLYEEKLNEILLPLWPYCAVK